jgi:hypothetical protein
MVHLIEAVTGYLFGCHHPTLSRVFTIQHRTYQVCCDCGREFEYSLTTMSKKRRLTFESWRVWAKRRERHIGSKQYQLGH